jgi:hypothetical protein
VAQGFAPEVMAYLKVRPDKLDDTQAQLAADHLVGASPRGWEDISNVLKSAVRRAKRVFVQGRIGAANAAEFFGVLRELQAGGGRDQAAGRQARRRHRGAAATTLDGLYGMVYGLLAACTRRADAGARAGDRGTAARHAQRQPAARARGADAGDGTADAARRWKAGWKRRCWTAPPTAATPNAGAETR